MNFKNYPWQTGFLTRCRHKAKEECTMLVAEENRQKNRFTAQGEITLRGQRIPYHTVCEDNFIIGSDGEPAGSVFTYAYFRSDVEHPERRPILFGFNGGPGSASLWLHLGLLGPRRISIPEELALSPTPPYELEDNPNCLLDMCDIVLVDPVGCGLGRLFKEDEQDKIFGFNQDANVLAKFMGAWLTRYGRLNSPLFLFGESYGTGRVALLLAELFGAGGVDDNPMGISVNGAIFLGCYFFANLPVEQTALYMSSMAAANWYHNREGKPDLETFFEEAHRFTADEYMPAIFRGDELSEAERERVIERMSYFTGLKPEFLRRHRLQVDIRDFLANLLDDSNEAIGMYDGRYKWKKEANVKPVSITGDDPASSRYTPAFLAGFQLLRKELNIGFDRVIRSSTQHVSHNWIRDLKLWPSDALAAAMHRNPNLKAFFMSGKYDLCTTAGIARYLASHSNLDPARVQFATYPSGHMAYIGRESARQLAEDMRAFYASTLR